MTKGQLNIASGECLIETVYRADGALERMRGLLGRERLAPDQGFWIAPCNSVHTFFMTYSLDILFLNKEGILLKIVSELSPWRMTGMISAWATVEMAAGQARKLGLSVGDKLVWRAC